MAQLKDLLVAGPSRLIGDTILSAGATSEGSILPSENGTLNLGDSTHKWKINGGGTSGQFLAYDGSWATPAYPTTLPANGGTAANVSGVVAVLNGGTGANTAAAARTNLLAATGNGRIFYGTCTTAAATASKEVVCTNYDALTTGDVIVVKFSNTNSAAVANLTLDVNGKGAKSIKKHYNSTAANNLNAVGQLTNSTHTFVYDGTYWILIDNDYDSNTNTLVRTYALNTSIELPLISGSTSTTATAPTHTSNYANLYGMLPATIGNRPTINLSTGVMTIPRGLVIGRMASGASLGDNSLAQGYSTTASGTYSYSGGYGTTAQTKSQHVFGEHNILDTQGSTTARGQYVEIVGNGASADARSNARTLDWNGNEWIAGTLTAAQGINLAYPETTVTGTGSAAAGYRVTLTFSYVPHIVFFWSNTGYTGFILQDAPFCMCNVYNPSTAGVVQSDYGTPHYVSCIWESDLLSVTLHSDDNKDFGQVAYLYI